MNTIAIKVASHGRISVVVLLILLTGTAWLPAQRVPTIDQEVTLYRYREVYARSNNKVVQDSIYREVRWAIQDARVHIGRGQEQLKLWDLCCSTWEVTEVGERRAETRERRPESGDQKPLYEPFKASDDVTFITSAHEDVDGVDRLHVASNRYPGFGGMDLFYSQCMYYPVQNVYQWLYPQNLGMGINTGADEYDLEPTEGGFLFRRRVDGKEVLFEAKPKGIVSAIRVSLTCDDEPVIIMNVRNCKNVFTTSVGFDDGVAATLPPDANHLTFKCCARGVKREFIRCDVTESTFELEDVDIRTHDCKYAGTLAQRTGISRFGIHVFESETSGSRALEAIVDHCLSVAFPGATIRISHVRGHLDSSMTDAIAILKGVGFTVDVVESEGDRTLIEIQG